MDRPQMPEHFEICRACLLNSESDKSMRFLNIFELNAENFILKEKLSELIDLNVDEKDNKSKMLCQSCYLHVLFLHDLKKHAAKSQDTIDFITKIRIQKLTCIKDFCGNRNIGSRCRTQPIIEEGLEKNVRNKKQIQLTSKQLLFSCIEPSCNLIFQTWKVFQLHHRWHFDIGKDIVCWQCFSTFPNISKLRLHQYSKICPTPGNFKCSKCSEKYDDIQNLSVHKYISHCGKLITNQRKQKIKKIICLYCREKIVISKFKRHLVEVHLVEYINAKSKS